MQPIKINTDKNIRIYASTDSHVFNLKAMPLTAVVTHYEPSFAKMRSGMMKIELMTKNTINNMK